MNNSVSLVITTYNRTDYLLRAINSVYDLNFNEIILVNDGSEDNYSKIIDKIMLSYPNIKYIKHNINRGLGIAKNTGIEQATSEWICCLDDDDYFISDIIKLKNFITNLAEGDIIHFKIKAIYKDTIDIWGNESFTLEEIKNYNIIPNGSFFKKSLWKELNGFRNIPFEDWDLWIRAKQKNYQFIFFPDIFYLREIRKNESSMLFRDQQKISYTEWKNKYIND